MDRMGWIKLHRKITEWEWWRDVNTSHLFIHLLLNANNTDKNWRGIDIKRGQVVTGRKKLSADTGLSERNIRTALKHLKKTNEVTTEVTNLYSLITVVNYDNYQSSGQLNVTPMTTNRPASDQQVTTTNNDKTIKNEKKERTNGYAVEKEFFQSALKTYKGTKRGLEVEFDNFIKKHKDWKSVLPELLPAIENRIEASDNHKSTGAFFPEWANFSTWINQRKWEEEYPTIKTGGPF